MDLLRGSGPGTAAPPVTRLLTVERDGNPLRRYGHVSPHIGKVSPVDADALREIADLAAGMLPGGTQGPTLVVGMAESALLLSWALASRLGGEAELRFTTRENRGDAARRSFLEPHSHGPVHALMLPPGRSYGRVVVVEDELTSGATLRNLLFAIRDVAPLYQVVVLSDRRPPGERKRLQDEMAGLGAAVSVLDLSEGTTRNPSHRRTDARSNGTSEEKPHENPGVNPFGRCPAVLEGAVDALWRRCLGLKPGTMYAVGECVDVAMAAWEALPERERPLLRHVTRSPWLVDGAVVRDRLELCAPSVPGHFLYNGEEGLPERAVIVGESSTAPVAEKLSGLLAFRGVETATVEVAGT